VPHYDLRHIVLTLPASIGSLIASLRRHERVLWAIHSLWALALGILVMWAGARSYAWLRVTLVYIAFLWVASLFVPALVDRPGTRWRGRVRLVVNYVTKNFYQQLLFFLLPVYYASATAWSPNMIFVGLVAASALLSTMDVVYDRHVSARRGLTAVFFAFNLFACINVMLPALWSISNRVALPVSAGLAVAAFATIRYHPRDLVRFEVRLQVGLAGIALVLLVALGRPIIPPAPLRVLQTEFGQGINRRAIQIAQPVDALTDGWTGRIYAVTSIYAPLGLRDRIGHRWYQDGRLVYASAYYTVEGGRQQGFRLWTSALARHVQPGTRLRVDVRAEAGQLVGRAELRAGPGPEADVGRARPAPTGIIRCP
jgi:hypothetical protein